MIPTSWTQILELIKNGDENAAVGTLYKKVFPLVKKYIISRGGTSDDAFDVFQDALLSVYKLISQDRYDEKYNVFGYLYNLSLNKWLNKFKRDRKIDFTDDIYNHEQPEEMSQQEFLFLGKDEELLNNMFSRIGNKCIEMLTYTIFKDMMLEDVMLRMGFTSLASVKMQHKRCKDKIMEEIEKRPELLKKLKGI